MCDNCARLEGAVDTLRCDIEVTFTRIDKLEKDLAEEREARRIADSTLDSMLWQVSS